MSALRLLGYGLLVIGITLAALAVNALHGGIEASPLVAVRGVSPDATSDNGQRKLARAEDGELYLAYSSPVNGVEQAHVSFSLDDGRSWKPETVLAQPGVWSDLATIAAGPNGRLDAAWVDYTSVGQVWYASLQNGVWSKYEKISPGDTYAGFPAMVIVDGAANVLWYAAKPDPTTEHGSAYEIIHTIQKDGIWSTPELLSTDSEDALNPALAVGPDGDLEAAWFQIFQGVYGAQVARYDGNSWTPPILISTPASTATGVSIAVDTAGSVHLVWEQTGGDSEGVGYSRFQAGLWSEPIMISEALSQDPVVATDSQNRVAVLWGEDGKIRARLWDGGWSDAVTLGPGTNPSSLSGDRILVTWTRQTEAGYELVTSYLETTVRLTLTAGFEGAGSALAVSAAIWLLVAARRRRSVLGDA